MCEFCFEREGTIPCHKCGTKMYCSEICMKQDYGVGMHSVECAHFATMAAPTHVGSRPYYSSDSGSDSDVGVRLSRAELEEATLLNDEERAEVIPAGMVSRFKNIDLWLANKRGHRSRHSAGNFVIRPGKIIYVGNSEKTREGNLERLKVVLAAKSGSLLKRYAKATHKGKIGEDIGSGSSGSDSGVDVGVRLSKVELDESTVLSAGERSEVIPADMTAHFEGIELKLATKLEHRSRRSSGSTGNFVIRPGMIVYVDNRGLSHQDNIARLKDIMTRKSRTLLKKHAKAVAKGKVASSSSGSDSGSDVGAKRSKSEPTDLTVLSAVERTEVIPKDMVSSFERIELRMATKSGRRSRHSMGNFVIRPGVIVYIRNPEKTHRENLDRLKVILAAKSGTLLKKHDKATRRVKVGNGIESGSSSGSDTHGGVWLSKAELDDSIPLDARERAAVIPANSVARFEGIELRLTTKRGYYSRKSMDNFVIRPGMIVYVGNPETSREANLDGLKVILAAKSGSLLKRHKKAVRKGKVGDGIDSGSSSGSSASDSEGESVGVKLSAMEFAAATELNETERDDVIPGDLSTKFEGIELRLATKRGFFSRLSAGITGHFEVRPGVIVYVDKPRIRTENLSRLKTLLLRDAVKLLKKHAAMKKKQTETLDLLGSKIEDVEVRLSKSEIGDASILDADERRSVVPEEYAKEFEGVNLWVVTKVGFFTRKSTGITGHFDIRGRNVYFVDRPGDRKDILERFGNVLRVKAPAILKKVKS